MRKIAHDDRYSAYLTMRSAYSRSIGTPMLPVLAREHFIVSLTSRFSTSPNSYCLLQPSDSMPVARYGVSCAPTLDLPSDPSRLRRVRYPRKSMPLSVRLNCTSRDAACARLPLPSTD